MLKFELSIDEVNKILAHLGKGSFEQVADLISKIKEQAIPQLTPEETKQEEPKKKGK